MATLNQRSTSQQRRVISGIIQAEIRTALTTAYFVQVLPVFVTKDTHNICYNYSYAHVIPNTSYKVAIHL